MLLRTLFGQDSELVDDAKKEGRKIGSELRKVQASSERYKDRWISCALVRLCRQGLVSLRLSERRGIGAQPRTTPADYW